MRGSPRASGATPKSRGRAWLFQNASVKRTGYRMPTEAEWEYFCRAGTLTSRPFGESTEFLSRYGWTWLNSDNRIHTVGELLPNEFGLFDVLGNAWEWCQDGPPGHYRFPGAAFPAYPAGTKESPAPDVVSTEVVDSIDRTGKPGGSCAVVHFRMLPTVLGRRSVTGSPRAIFVSTSGFAW